MDISEIITNIGALVIVYLIVLWLPDCIKKLDLEKQVTPTIQGYITALVVAYAAIFYVIQPITNWLRTLLG